MLEALVGLERMSIQQCESLAKEIIVKSPGTKLTFQLHGPKASLRCEWLDPHLGFFQMEGQASFVMVKQIAFATDLYCTDLMPVTVADDQQEEKED